MLKNWVKTLPSRRTTYAGGNLMYWIDQFPKGLTVNLQNTSSASIPFSFSSTFVNWDQNYIY